MLKKISTILTILLVIILTLPSNSVPVSAALTIEETATTVAYGAVVKKNNGTYGSIYSVRQALYTNEPTNKPDEMKGPSLVDDSKKQHTNADLCGTSSSFNSSWTVIKDNYCNGSKLNSYYANFKLDVDGYISVELQPDVYVERLNIYYAIAGVTTNNDSPTSMIFCATETLPQLCRSATYVTGNPSGTWKSTNKRNKTMMFTDSTMVANGFELKNDKTGGRTYSGYNVIDNMSDANKKAANKYGAYVIITMIVRHEYKNPSYIEGGSEPATLNEFFYVNTPVVTKKKFTGVRSVQSSDSANILNYTNAISDATNSTAEGDATYSARNEAMGGEVDKYAALVSKIQNSKERYEGMEDLLNTFDEYIKPALLIGLGVLLIVRGTLLIVSIVKSSDEPEERKKSIKHLVGLFVSIFAIAMILIFMRDIIYFVSDFILGNA